MSQTIRQLYSQICEELAHLRYLMANNENVTATVAVVPDKTPEEQHNHGPILPQHIEGKDAVAKAIERYVDLHIQPGICTKTARRTVGALLYSPALQPETSHIPACVSNINHAKQELKRHLLNTYPDRYQRFNALRDECPAIMALHLYRQIRCYHLANVEKIHFTWQRKTALVRPESKESLAALFHKEISVASEERANYLTELMSNTLSLPISHIRLHRPVQPQPSANVWINSKTTTVTAPMPILVIQNAPMGIKPLADFDPGTPPAPRMADKRKTQELGTLRGIIVEQILE